MLGPLRVRVGSDWSTVGAAHQRVVLAVLLSEAGRTVSVDRLVDEIWGEQPPRTARHAVQVYVRRLRQKLGEAADARLVTRGQAYQILAGDDDLDAAVFERMVDSGTRRLADGQTGPAVAELTEALALWRGPALADVPAGPTVAAESARLERRRLTAVEERLGGLLALGQHRDIVDEVQQLVEQYPLRERLYGQLMLALYHCGRRGEALAAYRGARRVLATELGVEPGPELRQLHQAMLADAVDPALPARPTIRFVPAQLPADVTGFTGRAGQLTQLDRMRSAVRSAGAIVTIVGAAGVGKTALAVHWAHRVREAYPDGQLYVNLRGYAAGTPLRPIDALARFLPALGLPAHQVPDDVEQAAAVYRSLLADRRMLVVLDNAHHVDQVRPLRPGGAGCLVLVTSRDRLPGLVAMDGAVRVGLDVLTAPEAEVLLARLIGESRVRAEPAAAGELMRLCGNLPLALRIVAAGLTDRPDARIADHVDELASGNRLAALQVADDPEAGVRTALDSSYARLPDPARAMFRLLGLVPGPDIAAPAAAALAGTTDPGGPLDRLTVTHLVEEPASGRYALHDLVRLYADERATAEVAEADRATALDRLYHHQLSRLVAAAERLYPQILRLASPVAPAGFDSDAAAMAWLDAERANLVASIQHCARHGPHRTAWQLADAIRGYLFHGMHTVDWLAAAEAGLAAAEADRALDGQAAARISLALHHLTQGQHEDAIAQYRLARSLARRAGWRVGESAALGNLASVYLNLGRFAEAADCAERSLAIDRRTGWLAGQASKLGNLGIVYFGLGRLEQAADCQSRSLALYQEAGSRSGAAVAMANLGEIRHAMGRLDDAIGLLSQAFAVHRELGDRHTEGDTGRALAAAYLDAGRHRLAAELAEQSVGLAAQVGDQRAQAMALVTRGAVRRSMGEPGAAVDDCRAALELARALGDGYGQTLALAGLAAACHDAGEPAAVGHARGALELARRHGYRLLERQVLAALAPEG